MKPVKQKPNRLDRLDLIMADQEALGMNDETETEETGKVPKPTPTSSLNGEQERNRSQAQRLLHYLTDEIGSSKTPGRN